VRKRSRKQAVEIGRELLEKVGIPEKADSYPSQLSGGQQRRVPIARAPALEAEMSKEVLDVMLDLAREGMTMVVVSHEMGFARAAANRTIFMDQGEIVEQGTPAELFANPSSDRMKVFLSKILKG